MKRRLVLACAGLSLAPVVGGCLQEETGSEPTENDLEAGDIVQFGAPLTADWYDHDEPSGNIDLFGSVETAFAGLDFDDADKDRRESVESFVAETEFDPESLLYIASVGPDTTFSVVTVDTLEIDDGVVHGTASGTRSSGGGQGGGSSHRYPSALVRITAATELPDRAEVTVVDGWDDETELVAEIQV